VIPLVVLTNGSPLSTTWDNWCHMLLIDNSKINLSKSSKRTKLSLLLGLRRELAMMCQ
jgi:hypothetical protein